MDYELAKELRDAGFPLQKVGCHECDEGRKRLDSIQETLYAPTLSELIDACMPMFISLENCLGRYIPEEKWCAIGNQSTKSEPEKWIEKGEGSTPEEAVAQLWLALNKK